MDNSVVDLSKYRFLTAKDELDSAKVLLENGKFKASVNRSYYAVFHSLRAVTALSGFDSSKHSGIIAYFNKNYVKEGIFDKDISRKIDLIYRLREKADYKDFYIVTKDEAIDQIEKAEYILEIIKPFLEERWITVNKDKTS